MIMLPISEHSRCGVSIVFAFFPATYDPEYEVLIAAIPPTN